jgi:CTP:molybdopterin cytidylyltransferase MocA
VAGLRPHVLILAAGAARRMRGRDKLLEVVGGLPLLARIAGAALATGAPVTVALPPAGRPGAGQARAEALFGLDLRLVRVADADRGMAESLKAGLRALPPDADVLLLLADLPEITAADLRLVLQAWAQDPGAILRGSDTAGRPGHPVGLPHRLREELLALHGDAGAREVLARHAGQVRLVPLPGTHATTDLDTPEDWAAWRASGGQ